MNTFQQDILKGLQGRPKRLSSKYFYDDQGSILFQQIMSLPEYYLTRSETDILEMYGKEIATHFSGSVEIIELGSGDGSKTKILLQAFHAAGVHVDYIPIDISAGSLSTLRKNMIDALPWLSIRPEVGDYLGSLDALKGDGKRKLVLFMGSNIGNYTIEDSITFLKAISERLTAGDCLMIGFDLVKHPKVIRAAYNDAQGVTKAFNLNLLARINREIGADFQVGNFDHYESYDPELMEARSYIISLHNQEVNFPDLAISIPFEKWEFIHVEVSRKYSLAQIEALSKATGYIIHKNHFDSRHYFVDSVWKKI